MKRWLILWNDLLNLFFPKTCLTCSKPLLDNEEQICLECLCDLPYTNFHKKKENRIGQLFLWNMSVEQATAFLYYEKGGHTQKLIHQLKYHDNPGIGLLLGRIAAQKIQKESDFFDGIDTLLPVPLHPKRQRARGYNQAAVIASGIQEITHLPIETGAVVRQTGNESQTHKQFYERPENVNSIFRIVNPEVLAGRHLLVIDDVITTGSTISSLCQTLGEVPEVKISIFSLSAV